MQSWCTMSRGKKGFSNQNFNSMLCVPQLTEHPSTNHQGIETITSEKDTISHPISISSYSRTTNNVKLYHELCNSIEANHLKVPFSKIISHDSCWWFEQPFSLKGGAEWGGTVWFSGDVAIPNQHCCFSVTQCGLTAPTVQAGGGKLLLPDKSSAGLFVVQYLPKGNKNFTWSNE